MSDVGWRDGLPVNAPVGLLVKEQIPSANPVRCPAAMKPKLNRARERDAPSRGEEALRSGFDQSIDDRRFAQILCKILSGDDVPKQRLIGVAAVGASVMGGCVAASASERCSDRPLHVDISPAK